VNQSKELIDRIKQGDETAFASVMELYQDMVYNTAIGIVQNAADADDITQDVFVKVYQTIGSFKGESKLSTWLYRITITTTLDVERKKKRKKRFAIIERFFGGNDEPITAIEFNHPGIALEKKETAAALFKSLKQLPEKQQIAFTLHKLEGQNYQEIAAIMNTSLYAVESLMVRAKANLKKYLQSYYNDKF
jgi:RNA polymerase sigma-70 factor (ECF subfamily)